MDPITVSIVVGGGAVAAAYGLSRWLARRQERVWSTAAGVLDVPLQHDPLRLAIDEDDVALEARYEVLGNRKAQLSVRARCVLADGPRFQVRAWDADARLVSALVGLEDVPIGDPGFDQAFAVSTDEPRSMEALLDAPRRRALAGLRAGFVLERRDGHVRLTWPRDADHASDLLDAIALVRAIAAVGAPLVQVVRETEGARERPRGPSGPPRFELDVPGGRVELRPVWWRTAPALELRADGDGRIPRFAVRWDAEGAVHGSPPEGLGALVEVAPRDALLRHDGERFRLLARPREPDRVRELARMLTRIAGAPRPGGAFR